MFRLRSYRVLLGESNSSNGTLQLIQKWASEPENVSADTYGILSSIFPESHTQHIAFFRNSLLKIMRQKNWLFDSNYLLVMDVDVNAKDVLTVENVLPNFEYDTAVMAVSQRQIYYYAWVLRATSTNYDCWVMVGRYWHKNIAEKVYLTVHTWPIPRRFGLIHVYSAFGGFGIYQIRYLSGCRYPCKS